ncbi:hydrolethalus syndrome protein 1 [Rana temporaria]|uniref:hydrolethalus syndrome protein 1 n=1 Tax=Rana temporaria TaxID=8407 RepID=UPI001AAD8887|nr:hydrolethalus syndrome protein 1 [Rana temporaria]
MTLDTSVLSAESHLLKRMSSRNVQRGIRHSSDSDSFPHIGSGDYTHSSVADCSLLMSVSEEDLRTELSLLGFPAIPRHRLLQFKEDLEQLMRSREGSETRSGNSAQSEKENIRSSSLGQVFSDWDKLSAWPTNASSSRQGPLSQGQPDSYSRHTVSLGQERRRAPGITRKVLRRRSNGQAEVCDESTLSSEVETCEEESLSGTSLDEERRIQSRRSPTLSADCVKSFIRVPPYSLLDQYRQHSDPVSRFHEYKQSWSAVQRVLERSRKEVRWGVRERMMSAPPAPLPRPLPAPNTYVIPTDKKRYGLRWAIRQDLVNGNIPRGGNS